MRIVPIIVTLFLAVVVAEVAAGVTGAVTTSISGPWIPFIEGSPFVGTPDACKGESIRTRSAGFTFEPKLGRTVYFVDVWNSELGTCRLLTPSSTFHYLFKGNRERWAFATTYYKEGEPETCNRGFDFVGLQKDVIGNEIFYSEPALKKKGEFCLGKGSAISGCMAIPLQITGDKRLQIINDTTTQGSDSLLCSLKLGVCGATEPIWETPAAVRGFFLYTPVKKSAASKLLCYAWSKQKC